MYLPAGVFNASIFPEVDPSPPFGSPSCRLNMELFTLCRVAVLYFSCLHCNAHVSSAQFRHSEESLSQLHGRPRHLHYRQVERGRLEFPLKTANPTRAFASSSESRIPTWYFGWTAILEGVLRSAAVRLLEPRKSCTSFKDNVNMLR